jgi:hypothetical protein
VIVHDVEQGTLDWMLLRLGLPTCSGYDRILTPKTRQPAAARSGYRAELLAEWMLGNPLEWGTSGWMERGSFMEDEAIAWYELQRGTDTQKVGFITRDDGLTGGSPDRLVGDEGGLEIKVLNARNHTLHLLGEASLTDYVGQVQGYLYLTDRAWWDVLLYNPSLPPILERVKRDDSYIAALVPVLDQFTQTIERDKGRLWEHRRRNMQLSPAEEYAPFTDDELEVFHRQLRDAEGMGLVDPEYCRNTLSLVLGGMWRMARDAQEELRRRVLHGDPPGPRLVRSETGEDDSQGSLL